MYNGGFWPSAFGILFFAGDGKLKADCEAHKLRPDDYDD